MLSKQEELLIDTQGESEIKRLHNNIVEFIVKNNGECIGFIDSNIMSNNILVNNLVNIRRIDTPFEFEDDLLDDCIEFTKNDNYSFTKEWGSEPIFDGDTQANAAAKDLGFITGWYDFYQYENKLKNLNKDLTMALDQIEQDGVIACTDHNHMVLNKLGLTDEMLNMFYHEKIHTLYDLPNFDDDILPEKTSDWSDEDMKFYLQYEPLVESMTDKEFNKCCELLNDDTIPCVYGDAIEAVLGMKKDNAWKYDPLMNAMYGYGEEYKQDYLNELDEKSNENNNQEINNQTIVGRDGLLETNEQTININNNSNTNDFLKSEESKHYALSEKLGLDEYLKALWFMEQKDLTIDDIVDNQGNYKADMVANYFDNLDEPSTDDWLKYLDIIGDKASGMSEFLKDINKSKDGKDREFTNFKKRSMGR